MEIKERQTWVDLAKVVSICLVTSFHTPPPLSGFTAHLVQLLRMPAFFLIAGFLFNDRKFATFGDLLKHRAKQLLIPYIGFEVIFIALTSRSLEDVMDGIVNAMLGHPTVCFPLWFLVCLFGMQVVHYLVIKWIDRCTSGGFLSHRFHLLLGYIVVCTLLAPLEMTPHLQLNAIMTNLPFYAVANCCKDEISRVSWRYYKTTAACLMAGLLLLWVKSYVVDSLELGSCQAMLVYLMHLGAGFLLLPPYIACCKAMSQAIGRVKWIEYMGSNTIVILAFHTYVIMALVKVLDMTAGGEWLLKHGWMNPLLVLLVVAFHWPIIRAINAWIPWLSGARSKKSL